MSENDWALAEMRWPEFYNQPISVVEARGLASIRKRLSLNSFLVEP